MERRSSKTWDTRGSLSRSVRRQKEEVERDSYIKFPALRGIGDWSETRS
jgi:hypothetical protein